MPDSAVGNIGEQLEDIRWEPEDPENALDDMPIRDSIELAWMNRSRESELNLSMTCIGTTGVHVGVGSV